MAVQLRAVGYASPGVRARGGLPNTHAPPSSSGGHAVQAHQPRSSAGRARPAYPPSRLYLPRSSYAGSWPVPSAAACILPRTRIRSVAARLHPGTLQLCIALSPFARQRPLSTATTARNVRYRETESGTPHFQTPPRQCPRKSGILGEPRIPRNWQKRGC